MQRRRILWLGAVLAPLTLGSAGCRLMENRPHLLGRHSSSTCEAENLRLAKGSSAPCDPCRQAFPTSMTTPIPSGTPYSVPTPTTNFSSVGTPTIGIPSMPSSWSIGPSYPVYPAGEPVVVPANGNGGGGGPANELPYPNISPPGVPENPSR